MKTIAQTYIDQGYEQARQEMELEIQKLRQEMAQEVQKAYQEARTARQQELQANERQGLLSSIEWGLELKFGEEGLRLFNEVQQIHRHASVAQDEPTFGNPRGAKVRQRLR